MKIEKIFNLRDVFSLEEEIEGVVFFRNIFDPDEMKKHRYKIAVKTRNFFLYSYFILKNEKKSIYTSTESFFFQPKMKKSEKNQIFLFFFA